MRQHGPRFNLRELKIEVTYRCDLNCVHCSSDGRPSNTLEMACGDCVRILEAAAKMGVENLAFSGGEPLLWPHIFEVVDAAVRGHLSVTIYTSGNVENFQQHAARLLGIGVTRFVFSMFGGTRITHERITRKAGSFERTKASIRNAVALGLKTELHFVPMSSNWRELPNVTMLAVELGATRVSVLRLVAQGRAALIRDRVLTRVQNLELRRQIQALRREFGADYIRTGSPYNFLMLNDTPACWAATDRLIVAPDLRLYPCDAFKRIGASELVQTEDKSCLANASLPECWRDSPYLASKQANTPSDQGWRRRLGLSAYSPRSRRLAA